MTAFFSRSRVSHTSLSRLIFGGFIFFCLLLILRNTNVAIDYVTRGLLLCARTVIPSLFPFMVLSRIIVSGGFGNRALAILTRPFRSLLRLSDVGCTAFALGLLCGFPVGATAAMSAYDSGRLTASECERIIASASIPSSAFLISAVGESLFGSRSLGLLLYAAVILSALLSAILLAHIGKTELQSAAHPLATKPPLRGAALLTDAIRSSTEGILLVCAYVIFFSALTGTVNLTLGALGAPNLTASLFSAFFELSSGVAMISQLPHMGTSACLAAAAVGWSGLSVHCQAISLADGRGLSLRPYLLSKLLQALLSALILALLLRLFPHVLQSAENCDEEVLKRLLF